MAIVLIFYFIVEQWLKLQRSILVLRRMGQSLPALGQAAIGRAPAGHPTLAHERGTQPEQGVHLWHPAIPWSPTWSATRCIASGRSSTRRRGGRKASCQLLLSTGKEEDIKVTVRLKQVLYLQKMMAVVLSQNPSLRHPTALFSEDTAKVGAWGYGGGTLRSTSWHW